MATIVQGLGDFSIGQVFARAFGAMRANPLVFFGTSFLLSALPALLIDRLKVSLGFGVPTTMFSTKGGLTFLAISALVSAFLSFLVEGALVRATVDHAHGARASFGACLAVGLRASVPLFVLTILLVLACYLGLALLLVPGVILYCMWAVSAPALVNERIGIFAAFGRSRFLTKGVRWHVLLVEIVVLVTIWAVSAALWSVIGLTLGSPGTLRAMADAQRHGLPVGFTVASVLVSTVLTTVWCAVQNALYVELSALKDGASPDRLADVFA